MLPPFVLSSYLLDGKSFSDLDAIMAFHRLYQVFSLPLPYFTLAIVRILPVLIVYSYLHAQAEVLYLVTFGISPSTCGLLCYMPSRRLRRLDKPLVSLTFPNTTCMARNL